MVLNVAQLVAGFSSIALLKANIAPENRPSQKDVSFSNHACSEVNSLFVSDRVSCRIYVLCTCLHLCDSYLTLLEKINYTTIGQYTIIYHTCWQIYHTSMDPKMGKNYFCIDFFARIALDWWVLSTVLTSMPASLIPTLMLLGVARFNKGNALFGWREIFGSNKQGVHFTKELLYALYVCFFAIKGFLLENRNCINYMQNR